MALLSIYWISQKNLFSSSTVGKNFCKLWICNCVQNYVAIPGLTLGTRWPPGGVWESETAGGPKEEDSLYGCVPSILSLPVWSWHMCLSLFLRRRRNTWNCFVDRYRPLPCLTEYFNRQCLSSRDGWPCQCLPWIHDHLNPARKSEWEAQPTVHYVSKGAAQLGEVGTCALTDMDVCQALCLAGTMCCLFQPLADKWKEATRARGQWIQKHLCLRSGWTPHSSSCLSVKRWGDTQIMAAQWLWRHEDCQSIRATWWVGENGQHKNPATFETKCNHFSCIILPLHELTSPHPIALLRSKRAKGDYYLISALKVQSEYGRLPVTWLLSSPPPSSILINLSFLEDFHLLRFRRQES